MFFKGKMCLEKTPIFQCSRKALSVFVSINPSVLLMNCLFDVANVRVSFIILKDQKTIHIFLNVLTFKGGRL